MQSNAHAAQTGYILSGEVGADPADQQPELDLKARGLAAVEVEADAFEEFRDRVQRHYLPRHGRYKAGDRSGFVFKSPRYLRDRIDYAAWRGIAVRLAGTIPAIAESQLENADVLPPWLWPEDDEESTPTQSEPAADNVIAFKVTSPSRAEKIARQRPVIRMKGGNLPEEVDQAEDALIAADLGFYQRGSLIVRPGKSAIFHADGTKSPVLRLEPADAASLGEAMTSAADFQRENSRGDWKRINCPKQIAETYLARKGRWHLPILSATTNTPILRADGSVFDQPGYDSLTGLLFDPEGLRYPHIPEKPSLDDGIAALMIIEELLAGFPFESEADRAVALSAILTGVARRTLPTAPLHAMNAPTPGTGKSLAVDIASMVSTGRRASVIAQGNNTAELEKRLGAALLAGDGLISLDNCDRPLGGEFLCQTLTQETVKVRILGKSKNVEVPTNAAVFATGNNLRLVGDMCRRSIRCSLDAGIERPELRSFNIDPIKAIQRDRPKYVVAALTALRSFDAAGQPSKTTPLGGFEDWSRRVRDCLIWLGRADPCDTMEEIRATDPEREELTSVMEQWFRHFGDMPVTTRKVIDRATKRNEYMTEFQNADFREALLSVAGSGGAINSKRLGHWISDHQNRPVGGYRFVQDTVVNGLQQWRLVRTEAPTRPL